MKACKTLLTNTSLFSFHGPIKHHFSVASFSFLPFSSLSCSPLSFGSARPYKTSGVRWSSVRVASSSLELVREQQEGEEDLKTDTVEILLNNPDDVVRLMKMDRKPGFVILENGSDRDQWFPYLDRFECGGVSKGVTLTSGEVLEAMGPYIMEERKERFRNVVRNRSYSVCLVVEGLSDFGNVSATFRSADALGIQSVHVVSCDSSKRCLAL